MPFDESTGALDYVTGKLMLEVIARINRAMGTTAIVITHNTAIVGMADRLLYLGGGRIQRAMQNIYKQMLSELSWQPIVRDGIDARVKKC